MSKIHLRVNKLTGENVARSICSSKSLGNGTSTNNSRSTYRFMTSEIVGPSEFREVPMSKRCMHCMDMGLSLKNAQRKAKGLPPVDVF